MAFGGRGGIRTHGTLAGTPVFKTGALNRSATLPNHCCRLAIYETLDAETGRLLLLCYPTLLVRLFMAARSASSTRATASSGIPRRMRLYNRALSGLRAWHTTARPCDAYRTGATFSVSYSAPSGARMAEAVQAKIGAGIRVIGRVAHNRQLRRHRRREARRRRPDRDSSRGIRGSRNSRRAALLRKESPCRSVHLRCQGQGLRRHDGGHNIVRFLLTDPQRVAASSAMRSAPRRRARRPTHLS